MFDNGKLFNLIVLNFSTHRFLPGSGGCFCFCQSDLYKLLCQGLKIKSREYVPYQLDDILLHKCPDILFNPTSYGISDSVAAMGRGVLKIVGQPSASF